MAPEVFLKQPYNEKVDVFSFGHVAYELLMRRPIASFLPDASLEQGILHAERVAKGQWRPELPVVMLAACGLEGDRGRSAASNGSTASSSGTPINGGSNWASRRGRICSSQKETGSLNGMLDHAAGKKSSGSSRSRCSYSDQGENGAGQRGRVWGGWWSKISSLASLQQQQQQQQREEQLEDLQAEDAVWDEAATASRRKSSNTRMHSGNQSAATAGMSELVGLGGRKEPLEPKPLMGLGQEGGGTIARACGRSSSRGSRVHTGGRRGQVEALLSRPLSESLSPGLTMLLSACWSANPNMRPSMWKVVEVLQEELMRVEGAVAAAGVQDAASGMDAGGVCKGGQGHTSSSSIRRHGELGLGDGGLGGRDGLKAGLVQDGCRVRQTPAMPAATAVAGATPGGPAAAAVGKGVAYNPSDLGSSQRILDAAVQSAESLLEGSSGRIINKRSTLISAAMGPFDVAGSTSDQQDQAQTGGAHAGRSRENYGRGRYQDGSSIGGSSSGVSGWWKWCGGWGLWG